MTSDSGGVPLVPCLVMKTLQQMAISPDQQSLYIRVNPRLSTQERRLKQDKPKILIHEESHRQLAECQLRMSSELLRSFDNQPEEV